MATTSQIGLGIIADMVDLGIPAGELGAAPRRFQSTPFAPPQLPPPPVFIQPGAGTEEIRDAAKSAGISVHEGCVLIEL